ncbi:MAG: aspartate-semialdehyde dehydrogenase [Christensenellaceae bacterium]|jgi:aspartate-semialdehyde dehydrogenase|nr:aspartate-semialdehyde dehydrogenase [Christensenellaceae bacterium]
MKKYNIAVVGATGMVGSKFLQVFEERKLPVNEFFLFASAKSAGKAVKFMGKDHTVIELKEENIKDKKIDFAVFSAGGSVSKEYAPVFAKYGTVVVDNSSQWRTDPSVPLVVPEVNAAAAKAHHGIIANPNCSTIQAVVALKPLHDKYKIKRIVYSTYQAVSGAGVQGYDDLKQGANGVPPKKFPYPIFGNVIPQIDVFLPNGYTKEEEKMIFETKKILEDFSLKITATTVRVPVFHGHSESINVEFFNPVTLEGVKDALKNAPGIIMHDDPTNLVYPMPLKCEDTDEVYVGRVRIDETVDSGINMFVVADNIRKGAATNAIQIVEYLIKDAD